MYVEQLNLDSLNNVFNQFGHEFLTLVEKAKHFVIVEHLISVISNQESLRHFVDSIEDTEIKDKLLKILDYDASFYSKIVASLLPKLKELG